MKLSKMIIAPVISVLALAGVLSSCNMAESGTTDFNMIFKYGVMARNELNTFEGTYTRDMIMDPPVTVNMVLTGDDLDTIARKMAEIDFTSYPDRFSVDVPSGEPVTEMTPFQSYYFKVEYESQVKELWWEDKIVNENAQADKLRDLIGLIISIIESKDEYKNLPAPKGGYL